MEKNLLEHFLAKASEIWSGLKTQHDHPMYTPDSSGLSGVEKYLAKLEQAAKQKEAATLAAQATGVEKYLARQQAFSPKAVQEVPTTGVGKYLARQTLTGSVSPKQPVAIPKTGVGKYLAGIPLTKEGATPTPVPVTEKKQPQQNKFEPKKTTAPAKEPPPSDKIKEVPSAAISKTSAPATAAATTSVAPAGDVIHFENVTQCQSRTLKGTQCKNTRHLTKLQRTINKQKYQFSACPQHHNDTFKPYPPLLEPH
ncbi:MAG: hypothetical protein ACXWTK_00005 [Methylobacter sp.]